jgi:replicative DNA helicase
LKDQKKNIDIDTLKSVAKKQPSATDVEMLVLGAMLLDKDVVPKVIEILRPECFYDEKHIYIFEAMVTLFEASEPIDAVSIYEELKKAGKLELAGGPVYIGKLAEDITSAANSEYHSKVILEKWILRKLINTSFNIANSAYLGNEDVFELLDKAEKEIFNVTEHGQKESYKTMDKAVKDAIEHIEAIHSRQIADFAVPSGIIDLDEMLGGFQKTDLVILAARPSMGKTAFALSVGRNAAVDHNVPIAIFSLEMSTNQLVTRLLCAEAKIDAHSVRTGKI